MFPSAGSPGFCRHLREHGLHLDGDEWGKMCYVFSCLLLLPHSQAAIEAISYLCVSEGNKATPVGRRLSLTHVGPGKLIPGGVGLTSLINVRSLEAFFRHSMFHLYSAHRATLTPDWAGSFSSSSAAGANGCLD